MPPHFATPESLAAACAQGNRHDVLRILCEDGSLVNMVVSNDGFTSLVIASQEGHTAVVRLLARAGADLDHLANNGRNAEDAARREHATVADWLAASRGFTALHFACDARDHAGVLALLRGNDVVNVGVLSVGGQTALHVALLADAPMALPLCEETAALMVAAASPWSARTHRVWPDSFRTSGVFAVVCVAKFSEGQPFVSLIVALLPFFFCHGQLRQSRKLH